MLLNGNEQVRTWEIHSTGVRQQEGKPARWVELHGESFNGFPVKYKLLIPEAAFGKRKHPIEKTVEA